MLQLVDISPHLFLQINKANKAHNVGGYLNQGPTLVLVVVVAAVEVVVVFECNPTRPPGRPAL